MFLGKSGKRLEKRDRGRKERNREERRKPNKADTKLSLRGHSLTGHSTPQDLNLQAAEAVAEDEGVGWHHRLDGHAFEQTLGDDEGQGSLACCSWWGPRIRRDLVTEQPQQQQLAWDLSQSGQRRWAFYIPSPVSHRFRALTALAGKVVSWSQTSDKEL